jgi:hypothetical protein
MQAGSSSQGQAPEPALSRKTSNGRDGSEGKHLVVAAVVTGLFTLLGALGGGTAVALWQTEREADLSLRDLRMETYATALESLYTYRQALDAYHEAALSPDDANDDAAARGLIDSQYPEYLAAWSRVRLLATPELLEQLDKVSAEITEMREKIDLVSDGSYGGDSLDVYIGEGDPLVNAVSAFQDQAISETREAD